MSGSLNPPKLVACDTREKKSKSRSSSKLAGDKQHFYDSVAFWTAFLRISLQICARIICVATDGSANPSSSQQWLSHDSPQTWGSYLISFSFFQLRRRCGEKTMQKIEMKSKWIEFERKLEENSELRQKLKWSEREGIKKTWPRPDNVHHNQMFHCSHAISSKHLFHRD